MYNVQYIYHVTDFAMIIYVICNILKKGAGVRELITQKGAAILKFDNTYSRRVGK